MAIFKIKYSNKFSAGGSNPKFTTNGKTFNSKSALTLHILSLVDFMVYVGKDIKLISIAEDVDELSTETAIELYMYNKLKVKNLDSSKLEELKLIATQIEKDGFGLQEFWDEWE